MGCARGAVDAFGSFFHDIGEGGDNGGHRGGEGGKMKREMVKEREGERVMIEVD